MIETSVIKELKVATILFDPLQNGVKKYDSFLSSWNTLQLSRHKHVKNSLKIKSLVRKNLELRIITKFRSRISEKRLRQRLFLIKIAW